MEVSNQKKGATAAIKLAWKQKQKSIKKDQKEILEGQRKNKLWEKWVYIHTSPVGPLMKMIVLYSVRDIPSSAPYRLSQVHTLK